MKPITIIIPLLAMLCGCDPWTRPVTREEFEASQARLHDYTFEREWSGFVLKNHITDLENRLAKLESAQRIRDGLADVTDLSPEPTNKVWIWAITNVTIIYTTNLNAIHLDRK